MDEIKQEPFERLNSADNPEPRCPCISAAGHIWVNEPVNQLLS